MRRHRLATALAAFLVLAVVVVPALGGAAARQGDEDPAVEFRTVAEQKIALDDAALVWQASELPTFLDEEHPIPFYVGFLYARDDPLIVYNDGGGNFTRLAADRAMPVEDGDLLAPVALRGDDATFLALELVAEDEAFDPTGDPFTPEAGEYVLKLLRAEFWPALDEPAQDQGDEDEAVTLEESELPVLLVVVAGEVELSAADEDPEELKAGDVLTVNEDVDLRWLGETPGVVLVALLQLPEEEVDRDGEADNQEDGADDAGPTPAPNDDADPGRGSDDGSDGEAGEVAPTPTPKPTEAPAGDAGDDSGDDVPADPPPTGGAGSGSGGSSGSGGVGIEEAPDDGECLFCAPATDGAFEEDANSDPCLLADGGGDPDSDGLNTCDEAARGADPNNPDVDGDDLRDGDEVWTYGTDPLHSDTDRDGLADGLEVLWLTTDPRNPDMDGDGLGDGDEYQLGTYLQVQDTDGDGLWDGEEVYVYGTDPLSPDTDGDCLWDGEEGRLRYSSDPLLFDTDGDGYSDAQEVYASDPRDPDDDDVREDESSVCSPLPFFPS